MLDYAAAYLQLGPIERRIYEVARSTCEGDGLDIDLATFRLQIGYQNPLSNFKAALKQIVAIDSIPDYHLELVEETVGEGEAADAAPRAAEPGGDRAAPAGDRRRPCGTVADAVRTGHRQRFVRGRLIRGAAQLLLVSTNKKPAYPNQN